MIGLRYLHRDRHEIFTKRKKNKRKTKEKQKKKRKTKQKKEKNKAKTNQEQREDKGKQRKTKKNKEKERKKKEKDRKEKEKEKKKKERKRKIQKRAVVQKPCLHSWTKPSLETENTEQTRNATTTVRPQKKQAQFDHTPPRRQRPLKS